MVDGKLKHTGIVGDTVSLDEAHQAAEQCAKNALAMAEEQLGSLDAITQILAVTGYVASTPKFGQHPHVLNGASDYLVRILGERGRHTRTAVGVASLPLNSPVEISFLMAVQPGPPVQSTNPKGHSGN